MEVIDVIMQWIVAPVAAFVWLLHSRSQAQSNRDRRSARHARSK
jgi:hypothetical protein